MKKTKFMRAALLLLVLTLITSCFVGGTFAKYTTSASGSDSARVAKWGFNDSSSVVLTDLFKNAYTNATNGETVKSTVDVIAPGTEGSAQFRFDYAGTDGAKPEVAYTFNVSTAGSECADSIKNNPNIKWSLDSGVAEDFGTWDQLIEKIEALDGNKTDNRYDAKTLPDAFNGTNQHTVYWKWDFETAGAGMNNQDAIDTGMGNAVDLANVKLEITITAEQID